MPDDEIIVNTPEGDRLHFPGGTDQQTIAAAMGKLKAQKAGGIPGAPNGLPPVPKPQIDMQGSNLATAVSAPKMGLESGLPSPAQVPTNVGPMQQGAAIGSVAAAPIAGGLRSIPALGRSLVGASLGSAAGGYGGQHIGKIFGQPELGSQIGATIGGLAGGITGGLRGPEPTDPVAQAVRNRTAAWLPTKVQPELGSPENPGWMSKLPNKIPAAKQVLSENPELAENPQDLISRMKKLVKPGEEPTAADLKRAGDLTQVPLQVLKNLAKFGDRLAQNELNRRIRLGGM